MTSVPSRRPLLFALATAWACSSPSEGPELTSVLPSSAPNTAPIEIRLVGNRLRPLVFADLDAPKSSSVSAVFAAELVGAPNVALRDVVWHSERELSATVPAGLMPGLRGVRVIDPSGRRADLDDAFEVTGTAGGSAGGGGTSGGGTSGGGTSGGGTSGGGTSGGGTSGGGTSGGGTSGGGNAGGGMAGGGTAGGGAMSMPPLAFLKITPPLVVLGSGVTFDATGSTDDVTPFSQLEFSWDFPGDNPAPPPWTPWSTNPVASHTFTVAAGHAARLAVRDGHGNIAYAERRVRVVAPMGERCIVDTASMADDGATNCTGASGPDNVLSFTEAVRLSNNMGGQQVISFAMPYLLTGGPNLTFTDGTNILAPVGTTLTGSTLTVEAAITVTISSLELTGQTSRSTVLGTLVMDDARFRSAVGLQVGGSGDLTFVRSTMAGCSGPCIVIDGAGATAQVNDSQFFGPPAVPGFDLRNCGPSALAVRASVFTGLSTGISIDAACNGRVAVKNVTFHANNLGINFRANTGDLLQNSIFSNHANNSVACMPQPPPRQNNLIWQNAVDGCLGGTPNLLNADPLYFAPDAGDFRLHWTSPAINSGIDAGIDINGPAPGDWTGPAPDRGGEETW